MAEGTDIAPLALKALVNHSYGDDVTAGYIIGSVERLRVPAQCVTDRLKGAVRDRKRATARAGAARHR
jgi:hypothetical protein